MLARDNFVFSLLVCAAVFSILGAALATDWQTVWRFFTLPTLVPAFGDMRTITGINFSLAYGFDPMLDNPGDPWGRAVNYPRIWIDFAQLLKLRSDDAVLLGMLFAAIYAAAVCGIGTLARSHAGKAVLFVASLSPACLLGLERANNDLAILALVVAFVAAYGRAPLLAWACLAAACVLKVFPVVLFALLPFLRGRQLAIATAAALGVALYLVGIRDQLALIAANTPISAGWSYGTESFVYFLNGQYEIDIDRAAQVAYAAWIGLAVAGASAGALWRINTLGLRPAFVSRDLVACAGGGLIYVATGLLGSNWDYRLMFLLLTVPLLARLAQRNERVLSFAATAAMALVVVAMLQGPLGLWFGIDGYLANVAAKFLLVGFLPGLVVAAARFDRSWAAAGS